MKGLSEIVVLSWNIAGAEALSANFEFIEREHLLISMTEAKKLLPLTAPKLNFSPAQIASAEAEFAQLEAIFSGFSMDITKLRRAVRAKLGEGSYAGKRGDIHRSQSSREVFERARLIAGMRQITALDLLRALMESPTRPIMDAVREQGADPEKIAHAIREHMSPAAPPEPPKAKQYASPQGIEPLLKYGKDLLQLASQKQLSPCIGRTREMGRMLATLWMGANKIPMLCGPKGVGKGVLVETLALRVWEDKAPGHLAGTTVIEMDCAAILRDSGDKTRFKAILEAMVASARAHKEVILFIDNLAGLLAAEASVSAAAPGPLLAALREGAVKAIAATTPEEFSALAADAGLAARLDRIDVPEPTGPETLEILRDWKSKIEVVHGVRVGEKALASALDLSVKFNIPGVYPKKAISLLDRACVRFSLAAREPEGQVAVELKRVAAKFSLPLGSEVDEIYVADAVAEALNTTLETVVGQLDIAVQSRIAGLEKILKDGVVGQNEVADKIFKRLMSLAAPAHDAAAPKTPVLFAFLGPDGVGKDEVARHIAAGLFGGPGEMTSFDMSQYSREEGIKKLFGNEYSAGRVVEHLSVKPFSVVMFENTDKTLPLFYEQLCAFLKRTDIKGETGRPVDLSSPIFIITSSLFSQAQLDPKKTADTAEKEVLKRFREYLPKHVTAAISEALVFKPLTEAVAMRILLTWLERARKMVKEKSGAELHIGRDVERFLMDKGYSKAFGLNNLRVRYDELFYSLVQGAVDSKRLALGGHWKVSLKGGQLQLVQTTPEETVPIKETT
jgi:ATP-dependent Clp protease ATP-binding subunit ClpC